jgi:transcriptional regulator with XRE-family HTH domain
MKPKIRERRMEKHLNQKQLAEKLKVSQNTLSKWETGKVYPSLKYLYRLEEILECTLRDLYDE